MVSRRFPCCPDKPEQRYVDPCTASLPLAFSTGHSATGPQNQMHGSNRRHLSASAQSNHSSVHRSSDGSVFSSWQARSSVASTNTTFSHFSDFPQDRCIPQVEHVSDAPSSPDEALSPIPFKRAHQRQLSQEIESFLTCVSRPKRSRRSAKEPRYWCTACGEGFREKYDWKRHEETYQERTESFECDLCSNIYFLDKDFIHHHRGSHRCQVCVSNKHVATARKKRPSRTGWGCGFCVHFSTNWAERCNHISEHYEKREFSFEGWKHSRVIWSLLQRPEILREWCQLLERKHRTQNPFSWKQSATGRSEGFPNTNTPPQLQDLLEFYTSYQDAAAIARLAFETGLRLRELPDAPPPVPEKDCHPLQPHEQSPLLANQYSAPYSSAAHDPIDISAWDRFLGSIIEDPFQANNVVMLDYDGRNNAFSNGYDNSWQC